MRFTFLCLVTPSFVALITTVYAIYNKDVTCIIDRGGYPVCETINTRQNINEELKRIPSYDPYIPRRDPIYYECLEYTCRPITLHSIIQVTSPKLNLKSCYMSHYDFKCETIRFNYMKNINKLLFLSNAISDKSFYLVDCLLYPDNVRVCHKKATVDSHARLVDMGTIVRPNEPNILSQDEFICEEIRQRQILCDLNPFVPFKDGLKKKDMERGNNVLLKTGNFVVVLKYYCTNSWCGYGGRIMGTRRAVMERERYEPPGGKIYRCFYANRQQVCKRLYGDGRNIYNERDWSAP